MAPRLILVALAAGFIEGLLGTSGGVHLAALAEALPGPRLPTREVRALLATAGIPG